MIRFAARGLLVGVALPLLVLAGGPGAAAQSGTPSATASPATAGDITIYRDEMGVPHVYADTAPAVFFGGSYAIAQDRLAQSELESRALLGRLAEVAGPSMIEADKTARIALPTDASMQAQALLQTWGTAARRHPVGGLGSIGEMLIEHNHGFGQGRGSNSECSFNQAHLPHDTWLQAPCLGLSFA